MTHSAVHTITSMGVRELTNTYRRPITIAACVLVVGAIAYSIRTVTSPNTLEAKAFYAVDDGSPPFVDAADRLPPFDHAGKAAFLAAVYSCDGGKTQFVGYLQRYTSQAKARIEARLKDPKIGPSHALSGIGPADIEIKKPGAANAWISRADPAAQQVLDVHCPDGGVPQLQLP